MRGADSQSWMPKCGRLYLSTPQAETRASLHAAMRQAGLSVDEPDSDLLAVSTDEPRLRQLAGLLSNELRPVDLQRTRCFLTDSLDEPTCADLMWAQPLSCLLDWINCQWIGEVISAGHLVTHFQPIVQTAVPDIVYGYECLLRGQEPDGQLISPYRLYAAARRTGLLNCLDTAARLTAIKSASAAQLNTRVFVNFNPRSIDGPDESLESTLMAAAASSIAVKNFVFEVVESDEFSDSDTLLKIADQIRCAGCRVALDDVGAGYNSLNLITRLKPDFIKLDMDMIRGVHTDKYKARVTAKLLELARELDVQTVVEGVEEAGEWTWAREHGADFAQGYLFARPAQQPPQPQFCGRKTSCGNAALVETALVATESASATCK